MPVSSVLALLLPLEYSQGVDALNNYPKLHDRFMVYRDANSRASFLCTATRRVDTFDVPDCFFDMVSVLDGTRTKDEVALLVAERNSSAERSEVLGLIEDLDREGFLESEDVWVRVRGGADPGDGGMFARRNAFFFHEASIEPSLFDSASRPLSERLRSATATLIGVGGTGSWVARSLAGYGVGRLRLVDPDVVELLNLPHQLLFSRTDVGRPKVKAAAGALNACIDGIEVETIQARAGDAPHRLLEGSDVVIVTANEPSTNVLARTVGDACVDLNVPHVVGGGYAHALGSLGLSVLPGHSPCWRCLEDRIGDVLADTGQNELVRPAIGGAGTVPALPAVLGSIIAWEAVQILIGRTGNLTGKAAEFRLRELDFVCRPIDFAPGCRCKGGHDQQLRDMEDKA